MKNFIEEITWRGMLSDSIPGTEEHLMEAMRSAYVGFDPTADSLHIGNLVPIMMLAHYQRAGHKPYALVGGATGMIGDPSGKSCERNLLDEETLRHNQEAIKKQLSHFLNFDSDDENSAELVNNYDWMKEFSFLEFIRDIGKHISVNYMMSKDSVKNRISSDSNESSGMSFTEFTYQLVQGYDFLNLFQKNNCTIQMGGSDQWGNITTGTEFIRKIAKGKGFAITCPLLTKSDGTKFGKSEGGNIWLDPKRTSPYTFYQYWINTNDEDAIKFIKIFTFLDRNEIGELINEHKHAPHKRVVQKRLAEEITKIVHSEEELINVIKTSNVLFGKSSVNDLVSLDKKTLSDVFNDLPHKVIKKSDIEEGIDIINTFHGISNFLPSNSEVRRALKENSLSVNKVKVNDQFTLTSDNLINDEFVLLQRGKKMYFVLKLV